jgi:hypothetical protein
MVWVFDLMLSASFSEIFDNASAGGYKDWKWDGLYNNEAGYQ